MINYMGYFVPQMGCGGIIIPKLAWEGYQLENKVCTNMARFRATKTTSGF